MRAAYHEALEGTRLDVVRLGALVGDAIRVSVEALDNRDSSAGARVVAGDTRSTIYGAASNRTASS